MIIKDDIISQQYQNHIQNIITNTEFPWAFLQDVTNYVPKTSVVNPAFSHIVFYENNISRYYDVFHSLLLTICDKLNIQILNLYRIRIGCLLRSNDNSSPCFHTDFDIEHKTLLYYVNTSDGDTLVENGDEYAKITPKSGRVLLFNGSKLHASSNPIISPYRFVVTFNFSGDFL